ncbi:MAG: sporulation protein YqfC [Anaerotignaceae bacterium]
MGIRRKVTEVLELPKEAMLNLPLITLLGREEIIIENYKGVVEYGEDVIRINTGIGVLKIEGRGLNIKKITGESVTISGIFCSLIYLT